MARTTLAAALAEAGRILHELREFHVTPAPESPPEYRLAAQLIKSVTYVAAAFPVVLPALVAVGVLLGRVSTDALSGNWLLPLAVLGAIPTFILLAYAYPAFVRGERWALFAIALVGFGLLALMPARFLTEAAERPGVKAVPPTSVEWTIFVGAALFLYFLLSPETRSGMRAARARNSTRVAVAPAARLTVPVAAAGSPPAAPAADVRYVCPMCGRVYHLKKAPSAGSLCPRCRRV